MLRFVFTIFILLYAPGIFAGPDTSSFFHFNLKNGLPSDNVYSAIQDKAGYIWLATDNGVVKYNGYTFEVYNTDNGGLPTNDVFELFEDRRGRIWIKNFSYLLGYIQNGKYKAITYDAGERIAVPSYFSEIGGLLYFVTWQNEGHRIVVVDDDVIKIFSFDHDAWVAKGRSRIYNLTIANDLKILIWYEDHRLAQVDPTAPGGLKELRKYPDPFRYSYTHRPDVGRNGKILLYSPGDPLIHTYEPVVNEYKAVHIGDWGADQAERVVVMSANFVKNNSLEHSGVITNLHVYEFNDDLELVNKERLTDIIPSSQQLVYRLKNKQRNYWYATNGDGVWVKPADYDLYSSRAKIQELAKSRYVGISGSKSFWWNSVKQELSEVSGGKITNKMTFSKGVDIKSVSGNDSIAYIGGSQGIYVYDLKKGTTYNLYDRHNVKELIFGYDTDPKSTALSLNIFRKIELIGDDIYGMASIGLIKAGFTDSGILLKNIDAERYTDCFFDSEDQKVYAYSGQRILIIDAENNIKPIVHEDLMKMGVGNIKQMSKGPHGNMFLLDESTLFFFDKNSRTVKEVRTGFSLSGAHFQVSGSDIVIAGKFGMAYAQINGTGSIGQFYVIPNSGSMHYSKVEDLVIDEERRVIVRNDVEWCSFPLDSVKKYAASIKDQNGYFSLTSISPFDKAIHTNDTLKINNTASILKLDAINYNGKGSVKYIYRISGSNEWQTSTSGEIFLAGLAANEYHKVECTIKDDLWESDVYTFYIYRYPKWWQTSTWKTIFWISGVLLFLGLVIMTILITRYFVAKKNARKRALTELELKAIHSQINPHFIFNTLSAALFYINKKRFDDAYVHVNKFSQLLRSYLKSSQDRYVMLEEEIKMLRNYIELQQIRFEEKFRYHVEIDNKLPTNNIRIPSLLLQPLVENAINHGLFHKGKGGILILKFEQGVDNTVLICTIEDNGVGRSTAKKINETNSAKDSYGTKLTNQLLEVFKLYENLNIDLKYFDKELPETGTIVILTLKNVQYVA